MAKLFLNFNPIRHRSTVIESIKALKSDGDLVYHIPNISGCIGCGGCNNSDASCVITDWFIVDKLVNKIKEFKDVYFCMPVHCNMPPSKYVNLISRLSMMSDNLPERDLFNGVNAHIVMIADISGTQMASASVMSSLNMVGFTLPPRCVYSYIKNWQDNKIRGGNPTIKRFVDQKEFKTKTD